MKIHYTKIICSSLMLIALVGCGKEKSSSSGSAAAPAPVKAVTSNPIVTNSNLSSTAQTAYTHVQKWFNASETANIGSRGVIYTKTTAKTGNTASASFKIEGSFCFFGYGINCNQQTQQQQVTPTSCYVKNGSHYDVGTPDGSAAYGCRVTTSKMSKSKNTLLIEAIKGSELNLVDVQETSAGVFTMLYGSYNVYGNIQVSKAYVINTNVHSILNPIVIEDASSITSLLNAVTIQQ